jgi:hypothetical protein
MDVSPNDKASLELRVRASIHVLERVHETQRSFEQRKTLAAAHAWLSNYKHSDSEARSSGKRGTRAKDAGGTAQHSTRRTKSGARKKVSFVDAASSSSSLSTSLSSADVDASLQLHRHKWKTSAMVDRAVADAGGSYEAAAAAVRAAERALAASPASSPVKATTRRKRRAALPTTTTTTTTTPPTMTLTAVAALQRQLSEQQTLIRQQRLDLKRSQQREAAAAAAAVEAAAAAKAAAKAAGRAARTATQKRMQQPPLPLPQQASPSSPLAAAKPLPSLPSALEAASPFRSRSSGDGLGKMASFADDNDTDADVMVSPVRGTPTTTPASSSSSLLSPPSRKKAQTTPSSLPSPSVVKAAAMRALAANYASPTIGSGGNDDGNGDGDGDGGDDGDGGLDSRVRAYNAAVHRRREARLPPTPIPTRVVAAPEQRSPAGHSPVVMRCVELDFDDDDNDDDDDDDDDNDISDDNSDDNDSDELAPLPIMPRTRPCVDPYIEDVNDSSVDAEGRVKLRRDSLAAAKEDAATLPAFSLVSWTAATTATTKTKTKTKTATKKRRSRRRAVIYHDDDDINGGGDGDDDGDEGDGDDGGPVTSRDTAAFLAAVRAAAARVHRRFATRVGNNNTSDPTRFAHVMSKKQLFALLLDAGLLGAAVVLPGGGGDVDRDGGGGGGTERLLHNFNSLWVAFSRTMGGVRRMHFPLFHECLAHLAAVLSPHDTASTPLSSLSSLSGDDSPIMFPFDPSAQPHTLTRTRQRQRAHTAARGGGGGGDGGFWTWVARAAPTVGSRRGNGNSGVNGGGGGGGGESVSPAHFVVAVRLCVFLNRRVLPALNGVFAAHAYTHVPPSSHVPHSLLLRWSAASADAVTPIDAEALEFIVAHSGEIECVYMAFFPPPAPTTPIPTTPQLAAANADAVRRRRARRAAHAAASGRFDDGSADDNDTASGNNNNGVDVDDNDDDDGGDGGGGDGSVAPDVDAHTDARADDGDDAVLRLSETLVAFAQHFDLVRAPRRGKAAAAAVPPSSSSSSSSLSSSTLMAAEGEHSASSWRHSGLPPTFSVAGTPLSRITYAWRCLSTHQVRMLALETAKRHIISSASTSSSSRASLDCVLAFALRVARYLVTARAAEAEVVLWEYLRGHALWVHVCHRRRHRSLRRGRRRPSASAPVTAGDSDGANADAAASSSSPPRSKQQRRRAAPRNKASKSRHVAKTNVSGKRTRVAGSARQPRSVRAHALQGVSDTAWLSHSRGLVRHS